MRGHKKTSPESDEVESLLSGSNQRPTDYKSVALPAELRRHFNVLIWKYVNFKRASCRDRTPRGAPQRPTDYKSVALSQRRTAAELRRHFNVLIFKFQKSLLSGSNQRPTDYKSVALPAELRRLFNVLILQCANAVINTSANYLISKLARPYAVLRLQI
jgi:hypothetical protein